MTQRTIGPYSSAVRRTFRQRKGQHQILKTADVEYGRCRHRADFEFTDCYVWRNVPS